MNRYLRIGAFVALPLATGWLWTAAASYLFCIFMSKPGLYVFPYLQWWEALPWLHYNAKTARYIPLSGYIPTGFLVLSLIVAARLYYMRRKSHPLRSAARGEVQPLEPGVSDNHGHSRWRTIEEARDLFPGPHPVYGGVVVGEAYRVDLDTVSHLPFKRLDKSTWGLGGKAPLLVDPCTEGSGSSITFSGVGGYKSSTEATTILYWIGSSVILDPSTELGPMLENALLDQGKRVYHVGIPSDMSPDATGIDVLAWIDINHPEASEHIEGVVAWIYADATAADMADPKNEFFSDMGKKLATCLLTHLLYSRSTSKTLHDFIQLAATPEDAMPKLLEGIAKTSRSKQAQRLAASMMKAKAEETFSSIYLSLQKGINWLYNDAYCDMVSGGRCDPNHLLDGDTTIFLNISLRTLENTPSLARVLVGALLNTLFNNDGKWGSCCLFVLDEAARLGHMKTLATARDNARKYGIRFRLLFQSIGQMRQIWKPDGLQIWMDAMSWIGYATIRAGSAGKDLAEQLGTHGVMAYSEGDNTGESNSGLVNGSKSSGSNVNMHEISHPLLSAAQMQQDMRDDEILIVPSTGMPIRCGRAIYFRRPEIAALVEANRFVTVAAEA